MKILGIELAKIRIRKEHAENVLKGVATSPGQVTGVAHVMENPEDFHQMNHGDILVASITTPAWTPLFALASGIVTDVGGPLSHGSIVTREYGIPRAHQVLEYAQQAPACALLGRESLSYSLGMIMKVKRLKKCL